MRKKSDKTNNIFVFIKIYKQLIQKTRHQVIN